LKADWQAPEPITYQGLQEEETCRLLSNQSTLRFYSPPIHVKSVDKLEVQKELQLQNFSPLLVPRCFKQYSHTV